MSWLQSQDDPRARCRRCDTPLWLCVGELAVTVYCSSCKTELERTRVVEEG
jgi:hypothetical protein